MTHGVLVVDDSAVVRKLVRERLGEDPDLLVVGHARDGEECLRFVERARMLGTPLHVVVLDEEMPRMTGHEVLRVLRRDHPDLAVVLFSTHVQMGAEGTMDALFLGADDAVRKPSALGDAERTWQELVTKVHAAIARHAGMGGRSAAAGPAAARGGSRWSVAPVTPTSPWTTARVGSTPPALPADAVGAAPQVRRGPRLAPDLAVVGSSTGGPAALSTFLRGLRCLDVPMLVVQHMPPVFTRRLADRLHRETRYVVREAVAGEHLEPGVVLLAPGDLHLAVARDGARLVTTLDAGPAENSCRPAVDVLFRSAAQVVGGATLAVVLTGMGQDGLLGARLLAEAGGTVIVQDEATSTVWGMPGAVARAGLADAVLPLDAIGPEVALRVDRSPSHAVLGVQS